MGHRWVLTSVAVICGWMGCTNVTLIPDDTGPDTMDASPDATVDTDADTDSATDTANGEIGINGTVTRSIDPGIDQDGIGTLCVQISKDCPSMANMGVVDTIGLGQTGPIDLADPGAVVDFFAEVTLTEAAKESETYSVHGYLAESGGDCPATGYVKNDLNIFGESACALIVYSKSQGSYTVDLDLNTIVPI